MNDVLLHFRKGDSSRSQWVLGFAVPFRKVVGPAPEANTSTSLWVVGSPVGFKRTGLPVNDVNRVLVLNAIWAL